MIDHAQSDGLAEYPGYGLGLGDCGENRDFDVIERHPTVPNASLIRLPVTHSEYPTSMEALILRSSLGLSFRKLTF